MEGDAAADDAMNIRDQLGVLVAEGVEFIVIGGQAGVLRQAIEFSHDLDVLIRPTRDNAARVQVSVKRITGNEPEIDLLLGRDFQQYIDDATGTEIDVHLKLIAVPGYEQGVRNAGEVDFLGIKVQVLELPALYASKRTDRPRDAIHRQAIEHRLRDLVLGDRVEVDDVILACCLDEQVAASPKVSRLLAHYARESEQPLLQTRLFAWEIHPDLLSQNPSLHVTVKALFTLDEKARDKLVKNPARLAALLARVPLLLPEGGYHVRPASAEPT